jgi:hypothetical protein
LRRVVLIVLALVIVPSIAMATSYRCMYDGVSRAACCCVAKSHGSAGPARGPAFRAACCCEVTQATAASRAVGTTASELPLFVAPVAVAVVSSFVAPSVPTAAIARPCEQRGPPSSLLARRCSLLL